jgi:hypothetical protein
MAQDGLPACKMAFTPQHNHAWRPCPDRQAHNFGVGPLLRCGCSWALAQAGPLPQYHPAMLAALVLAGKAQAAAAVLHALLAWMQALRQHAAAQQAQRAAAAAELSGAEGEAGRPRIGEGSPARLTPRGGAQGAGRGAAPAYKGGSVSSLSVCLSGGPWL